jgi:hypothetical protein
MKQKKILLTAIAAAGITIGGILFAADHIDSPAVTNQSTDITDMYVFQGADAGNLVFVANTQGLLAPSATAAAAFDPNTLIQFNIDNNGDDIEDLVIQAIYKDGKINIYGPVAPSMSGTKSKLEGDVTASVAVTAYGSGTATVGTGSGIKVFAGPRDDPFFFDLTQFKHIIAGDATAFENPGTDTFAGTNVMSIVVEVPKSQLKAPGSGKLNVWLTTKKKV